MEELWAPISEFEEYSVSNYGCVRNSRGNYLSTNRNQRGLLYVTLYNEGHCYSRSLAPLVANGFLDPPPHHSWNTPIHLNGNRTDVFAGNLMWRPRWFAIDYHQQINQYSDPFDRVRDVSTGEEDTLRAMCMRYGLLQTKVYAQAANYTNHGNRTTIIWPTGQMFELM